MMTVIGNFCKSARLTVSEKMGDYAAQLRPPHHTPDLTARRRSSRPELQTRQNYRQGTCIVGLIFVRYTPGCVYRFIGCRLPLINDADRC